MKISPELHSRVYVLPWEVRVVLTAALAIFSARLPSAIATEPVTGVPARVEFNRDIRPILSDKCFACHGPDGTTREAELRLDRREHAVAVRNGSPAIVPGKSANSELMSRVRSADPDLRMPPAASGKSLTARERSLLAAWIDQGAEYELHWSFRPLADVQPPAVDAADVTHPIDRFIRKQLQERQLQPSPPADARTLIRRMSLDLIGVLPAPERVDRFVVDFGNNADVAVQQLARELLASPHYGERWGRHWLDQARYADSHGYTIDGDRQMWPYRDWVIHALNEDMPFDRFTIEQLAGDLLPEPTKSQLVATGFHRNTLINQEGGTDNEQFRNEEVVDRVNTTSAVWLGLTFGCAQCHNHKFDPISQREYYELFAFFNHTADVNNVGPTVSVREGELLRDNIAPELLAELQAAEEHLQQVLADSSARQTRWEQELADKVAGAGTARWQRLRPGKTQSVGDVRFEVQPDNSLLASRGAAQEVYTVDWHPADTTSADANTSDANTNGSNADSSKVAAVRLHLLTDPRLPNQGPGRAGNGNFVLTGVRILFDGKPVRAARVQADHEQPGYPVAGVLDHDPNTGWAINTGAGSRAGAKMNAPHEAHFVLDEPVPAGWKTMTLVLSHERNEGYNIGRFGVDVSPTPPAPVNTEALLAIVKTRANKRTADQSRFLAEAFRAADQTRRAAEQDVATAQQRLGFGKSTAAMVMQELPRPRETWIHIRGDFLRKDHKTGPLQANVAAVLPPLFTGQDHSAETRPTRLDLARWLVREDHPLTARVTVNRVWMRYFGRGIVETENDFGTQGDAPTHPELLDWLAAEFMRSGWSMKKLHELIVTSATYRQSSRHRSELNEIDPLNKLLARQNRLRVDAEIVRDLGLSASGLLNPEIGGPGVRPPQPDGVYAFTQQRKSWQDATGPERYRRGLYTQFYRSAPYPLMTTFDSPDFQTVCTRRPRSNTPLQSLTMANDAALFEMNQALAARLLNEIDGTGDDAEQARISRAFQLCFCRPPADAERDLVQHYRRQQEQLFAADAEAAAAVAPAAKQLPDDCPQHVAASWTAVARALMNTDEFITRE